MTNVLSIENALSWSWGLVVEDMARSLKYVYNFVRITRKEKIPIDVGLLEHFPVSLLQNADNMPLITKHKRKVVTRMGGMVIGKDSLKTRYDKELAQAGAVIGTNKQLFTIGQRVNGNSYLIPNGVDMMRFRPNPDRPERDFTMGFAGNIWGSGGNYKGWPLYVQATLLLEGTANIKHRECLHNGPGAQRQVAHDRMAEDFYWKIDCLILPSKGEGCSNVTGEALACGVPVVTTKVGYHGEMLTDGENVLFIERTAGDIIDKVMMLRDDPDLCRKLAENGRNFVAEHQDIHKIAREYDRVFKSVLQKTG